MNSDSERQPAKLPTLPEDIIVEILCRLPVKTLLRFRCVSKQLRSLIDDPNFINRHLQYQSSYHQKLVFRSFPPVFPFLLYLDLDVIDNVFDLFLPVHCTKLGVLGSCDGLLAVWYGNYLNDGNYGVILWNISTRKHRFLPRCEFLDCYYKFGGFGRDAASDDYKLVAIEQGRNTNFVVSKAAVYSLKFDCWSRIEIVPSDCMIVTVTTHVAGTLYWWAWSKLSHVRRLVGFDLKNEKFFEVPYTDKNGETIMFDPLCKLMDLGGRLGVFRVSRHDSNDLFYEVLVLEENGLEYTWTKLYTIPLRSLEHDHIIEGFVHSNQGDVIFMSKMRNIRWFGMTLKRKEW